MKANGYFMVPTPGTIPVDENGQPLNLKRDTVFLLFVETHKVNVHWEKAWHDGRSFSLLSTAITESKAVVGKTQRDDYTIELLPKKGNSLWKLELADDSQRMRAPQALKRGSLLLKGLYNKKSFYLIVSSLTELASPLYQ